MCWSPEICFVPAVTDATGVCLTECASDSDCPAIANGTLHCALTDALSGQTVCGFACNNSSVCPTGTTCQAAGGGNYCVP
jgi:hypothetical protein